MVMLTMKQFIEMHKLNVRLDDAGATRLIAKKLRDAGYKRVKRRFEGKVQWVWMKDDRRDDLNAKLEVIDLE